MEINAKCTSNWGWICMVVHDSKIFLLINVLAKLNTKKTLQIAKWKLFALSLMPLFHRTCSSTRLDSTR